MSRLAHVAALLVAAVMAAGTYLSVRYGDAMASIPDFDPIVPGFFVAFVPFALSGWYLAWRKPANSVGWLLMAIALLWTTHAAGIAYAHIGLLSAAGPFPLALEVALAVSPLWLPAFVATGLLVFLFPTGRPVSPRWRIALWLALVTVLVGVSSLLLLPGLLEPFENPIGWEAGETIVGQLQFFATIGMFVLALVTLASLVVRYRRGDSIERQQMKWLLSAFVIGVTVALLVTSRDYFAFDNPAVNQAVDVVGVLGLIAVGLMPFAIAVAVMRYGLYDLGKVINRTIVYSVLVLTLAAIYATSVVVVTTFLPSSDSFSVAMSTLLVAAAFRPLQRRLQQLVDRRFNRSGYDPESVRAELEASLRHSVVSSEITEQMEDAVVAALQPSAIGIWTRDG